MASEMIAVVVDVRKMLRTIEEKLGPLKKDAPKILEKSLNAAGRKAKKLIAQKADETYNAPENESQIKKAERMKRATTSELTTFIRATSPSHALSKFPFTFLSGDLSAAVKAGDYKTVHYERMSPKPASKPFFVGFKNQNKQTGEISKHNALVYRKTKKRYPIKEIMTVPLAFMIGNKENFEEIRPDINEEINIQIKKQLNKLLV